MLARAPWHFSSSAEKRTAQKLGAYWSLKGPQSIHDFHGSRNLFCLFLCCSSLSGSEIEAGAVSEPSRCVWCPGADMQVQAAQSLWVMCMFFIPLLLAGCPCLELEQSMSVVGCRYPFQLLPRPLLRSQVFTAPHPRQQRQLSLGVLVLTSPITQRWAMAWSLHICSRSGTADAKQLS